MKRRAFLAASAATLAAPALAQRAANTLRVVPQANLTSIDPVWTTATITQTHGYAIYDQLVGIDSKFRPQPQMAEGWVIEDDGKRYIFTLRDGLKFHDGEKVLAKDVVASIKRWGARDGFGQELMSQTDELVALDDKKLQFRLKRTFPLLLDALGRLASSPCFVMPERIAQTDPFTQIKEAIGSGPFRFLPDEWVPGAHVAYAKNADYVAREGKPDWTAGGRHPYLDRVEWEIINDPGTVAAALQAGELDYWEFALHDTLPAIRRNPNLVVGQRAPFGWFGTWRFNHLQKPFDNPAIRRAVAMGVDQADFQRSVVGDDPKMWGYCKSWFTCGTPFASTTGGEVMDVQSVEKAKVALKEAGYAGERIVVMVPADFPQLNAQALVSVDLLQRLGMNVDAQTMDWGTLVQRRASKEPLDKGGWSIFLTLWGGDSMLNPAVHQTVRCTGEKAWFGWPSNPAVEEARTEWFYAPDFAAQKAATEKLTVEAFKTMPYIPTGYYMQPAVWRSTVTDVDPTPLVTFWGLKKSG